MYYDNTLLEQVRYVLGTSVRQNAPNDRRRTKNVEITFDTCEGMNNSAGVRHKTGGG